MADFTYMGTKRLIAPRLVEAASKLCDGPFLDLFSGISAAGKAIAEVRNVWCNDMQSFSVVLTKALYTSVEAAVDASAIQEAIREGYQSNLKVLNAHLAKELDAEKRALAAETSALRLEGLKGLAQCARLKARLAKNDGAHALLSMTHSGTYFGVRQCVEMDSIRFGADAALAKGALTAEQHRWAIIAICRAAYSTSNSTGHFAQALTPRIENLSRVVSKRRRDAHLEWLKAISDLSPVGTAEWRSRNRIFQEDAAVVLKNLAADPRKPGVVYADPPYTDDQYSRYYHVLENIIKYDYPDTSGVGEYRADRFTSSFSLATKVEEALKQLIENAAYLPSAFMLSYPSNGLLPNSKAFITDQLSLHFKKVHPVVDIAHEHSTLGASKGAQKHAVTEHLYIAEGGKLAA